MIPKEAYEKALMHDFERGGSMDYGLSSRRYIIFGTCGVSITKVQPGGRCLSKHVAYWREYTLRELNKKLRQAAWTE